MTTKPKTLDGYPDIANLWHPEKNDGKLPSDYTPGSNLRVWLQCRGCLNCGEVHSWNAQVFNLTAGGPNKDGKGIVCPRCQSRGAKFCSCRAVAKDAALVAEWHEDNPPPATVALGSNTKQLWRCSKPVQGTDAPCAHVWATMPKSRSKYRQGCPKCAAGVLGTTRQPPLADGRPDLLMEWDKDKNGTLSPTDKVTCGSIKLVWWTRKQCGGSWQATVINRAIRGGGCPKCLEKSRGRPSKSVKK